jgi:N12 class adenine-specific DNA methylase
VKTLEKAIVRTETRLKELLNAEAKDDGVAFDATGIDYLFVDEAHLFKNLAIATRINGAGQTGSQRAEDLHLKLDYLRRQNGERVATLATATPIANSLSEMYVMQRYLQPGRLAQAGVAHFDAWAANFGATVTALELAPDGGGYRINTRFARFRNVPDLVTMFSQVADVRTPADLNLRVPALAGGKPETVVVPATETLSEYVAELVERAERGPQPPGRAPRGQHAGHHR